ncbi:Wzy polymerase domain-containing protein [Kinneretia asaccharophila]|uniref:O-antigen ligase n=1 Tax=Roseateles asaccharophilus TaxID=582607 RepID=A0A4R6NG43_9BURK|nr:O-antigen ligase family protein [Roseateles asaccharophilus]MDN3543058.1 Wzy polymerase domain-containing protein [Roseateles asaccharophilus]TDP13244.1 O-antigen ligase [Roseateles asaccharophilus]
MQSMSQGQGRPAWGPLLATALPPLLAYNLTPSATLFNQLLALGAWGAALLLWPVASGGPSLRGGGAAMRAAVLALLLLLGSALLSPWLNDLPMSLAWQAGALLVAALLVLQYGARVGPGWSGPAPSLWAGFCWGLLAAGLLSLLIGVIQVFAPQLADGNLIARSGIAGRAVGNLRQPNHLASLLMWACVAAVWLSAAGQLGRRSRPWLLPVLLFALVFGVVLSASRTGMLGVVLLALWGLLDRRLPRAERWALMATPLMLALSWAVLSGWSHASGQAFGAESRLAEGAGSPSRLAILANAWTLLKMHPWTGVGWGEFNLAWTMTPFPDRPVAFFDHTHNIVMQLLVELGWPLGLLVLGLLTWVLFAAWLGSRRAPGGELALMRRCAFMVVLMIGLHSLLEYPLWYAYFLLPTLFALGVCLAPERAPAPRPAVGAGLLRMGGVLMLTGSALAVWDYLRVVDIYMPPAKAASLESRIERGQGSVFFATQADYAAATTWIPGPLALEAAQRTAHNLIDVRLMMAWAKSLNASGDVERARYVVARLREFRSKQGEEWLLECEALREAGLRDLPFQCEPAARDFGYREMR